MSTEENFFVPEKPINWATMSLKNLLAYRDLREEKRGKLTDEIRELLSVLNEQPSPTRLKQYKILLAGEKEIDDPDAISDEAAIQRFHEELFNQKKQELSAGKNS